MKRIVAVTAASGRLGHAVAKLLLNRRPSDITLRFTARSPEKVSDLEGQVLRADYDDPASMKAAFVGVDTLLLVSGMGSNEERIRQHRSAITCAKEAGVKRIVYTSFTHATAKSRFIWAKSQADAEAFLMASGVPYTILRNNQYFANLEPFLMQARETGTFSMPGMEGRVAYVSHADLAEATVAVLLGDGHGNRIYELTGPEAIDGRQIALALSKGLRKEVKLLPCPPEAVRSGMEARGLPPFVIDGLMSLYDAAGHGEYQAVSGDTAMLLQHPALSLLEQLAQRSLPDLRAVPDKPRAPRVRPLPAPSMRPMMRQNPRAHSRHH